ncbi:MAG: hypothetical protein JJU28_02370 [Cyclobacteriaceae bacterium]|nr:hypothetical protein [Cyclobacteriaceae bacterium]
MERLFLFISIGFLFVNCSDDEFINHEIVGEWALAEVFNGYVHGGNFKWTPVAESHIHIIRFTADGKFFENIDSPYTQGDCYGTFRLLPENILEIDSSCQTVLLRNEIEVSRDILIINIQVRGGLIREKYVSLNS